MTSGMNRILPFLGASVAMHVIAIGALGTDPLIISVSSDGAGHEVSVRLEAAAPASVDASPGQPSRAADAGDTATAHRSASTEAVRHDSASTAQTRPQQSASKSVNRARTETAEATPAGTRSASAHTEPEHATTPDPEPTKPTDKMHEQMRPAERMAQVQQPATGSASASSEARRSAARQAIVVELAKHFTYPRLAQRRGWEGTVVLQVRILSDGRLGDIAVKSSSGRALLDESAASALGHVERLPQFADRVGDEGLALEIPVTYRLESA